MGGALFVHLFPQVNSVYEKTLATLTEKVEEALEESWKVQVEIERMHLSFFRPELLGVKAYTLDGRPLLTAERVRIRLNWLALLFGRKVNEALRGVELNEPVLWLDATEKGGLRFPKINKGDGASSMPRFIIKISGGDLRVRSGNGAHIPAKWPWGNFTDIDGRVDLREYPRITVTGRFFSNLDPQAQGSIFFEYCQQDKHAYFEITCNDSSAKVWGDLVNTRFRLLPGLALVEGKADFSLRLLWEREKGVALDYVQVKMAGAEAEYAGVPESLQQITTEFIISPEKIDVKEFSGDYHGGNLAFSGRILPEEAFFLDLQLAAKNLELSEWTSLWPALRDWEPEGKAGLNLQIKGALPRPEVKGEISLTGAGFRAPGSKWQVDDLRLAGECCLNEDEFIIDCLEVDSFDGKFSAAGRITGLTQEPVVNLEITGRGVNLEEFPFAQLFVRARDEKDGPHAQKIPALAGRGDFLAVFHGPLSRLRSEGRLTITGGAVEHWEYGTLEAEYSWNGTRLNSGLTLEETTGGRAVLTGWWEPGAGRYYGEMVCRSLDFQPELLGHTAPQLSGLSGKLSGTLVLAKEAATPTGSGWLELHDLHQEENSQLPGRLLLRAEMEAGRVRIEDSYLLVNSGRLAIDGEVSWEDGLDYRVRACGDDISLDDLISFLPSTDRPVQALSTLKGMADLEIVARGGPQPVVTGYLAADGFLFKDFFISRGETYFYWKDGEIRLSDARLQRGREEITVNGVIRNERLDLQVAAEGFSLSSLEIPLYNKKLTGFVKLDGKIGGTFASPAVSGEVEADRLNIAGLLIEKVTGKVKWEEEVLSIDEMRVVRGKQELQACGEVDFKKEPVMDFGLSLERTEIAELLLLLGISPAVDVTGKITGSFRVLGSPKDPAVRIVAQLDEGRLGDLPVTGEADLQIRNSTVEVNRLLLTEAGSRGKLTATAFYRPGQEFRVKLDMEDFALTPLALLAGYDKLADGQADLQLAVKMNGRGVTGEFAGFGKGLILSGVSLPEFAVSGSLEEAVLYLQGKDIQNNRFSFHGLIPLNYSRFRPLLLPPVATEQAIETEFQFVLAGGEAAFFNIFLPQPLFKAGTVDGNLVLKGENDRFHLNGALKAEGISGVLSGLPEEFRGVGIEVEFANDRIDLKQFTGRYGRGHFRGEGNIFMDGMRPEKLDLRFTGNDLYYSNAMFDGQFDGELFLTGSVTDLLLKGEVLVEKTRISLAASAGLPSNFDLQLDLDLKAGRDVYFRQYGLASIPLNGSLHVGGRLSDPEIIGELTADRGWLNVYGDTFQITKARAEFRPEYELLPYLDLEASLFLTGTQITLETQGWAGNNLLFTLSSNPGKSKEEIFALLNWSEQIQDPDSLSLGKLVEGNIAAVTDGILGPFFDQFRELIQIDLLSLEQDRDLGGLRMNVGKALGRDVFLSYSRNLSTLAEESWTLEGRLSLNLSLLGEYSSNQGWQWRLFYNIWF